MKLFTSKDPERFDDWHKWFAWYPVPCWVDKPYGKVEWIWLESVIRNCFCRPYWYYRIKNGECENEYDRT